jgi:hypothetical protein
MTINLSSYNNIECGLFVRIECDKYRANESASFTTEILRFSDINRPITIVSETYTGLGRLLGITASQSELRVTTNDVTITLSGIPNSSLEEIMASRLKGSLVKIYRGIFNSTTGALLSITDNPVQRFSGFITNFSLGEEYDYDNKNASNTIVINCASTVSILESRVSGRKTNPESMKYFYPTDVSMDRVNELNSTYFDFGAPTK